MGLRIDFMMVSPRVFEGAVRGCNVLNTHKKWSDHVAMDLFLDDAALGRLFAATSASVAGESGTTGSSAISKSALAPASKPKPGTKSSSAGSAAAKKAPPGSARTWLRFKKRTSKLTAFFGAGAGKKRPREQESGASGSGAKKLKAGK